jgi:hypothetical protein
MHMNFYEILGPIAVVFVAGWVVRSYLVYKRQMKVAQMQAEMQNRLMDRFDSSEELMTYLGSEAGQRFIESATLERANPYGRILGSIQAGVILTFAGVAALLFRAELSGHQEALGFSFLGLLFLALGLGFLVSAAASYALSKKWGVINGSGASLGQE